MPRSTPRVLALVPMKPLAEAKSRLSPAVPEEVRRAVVLLMLEIVARAAAQALGPKACRIVGGDAMVAVLAREAGAEWRPEEGNDLNSSLWLAMQAAYEEGYKAALYLPSDLPQAEASDILKLVDASEGLTCAAGVEAERDGGTNALLLPSSIAFPPRLGRDSFARHREAAAAQGTPLAMVQAPSLAVDVDSAEDLAWARAHVPGFEPALSGWRERVRREYPDLAKPPTG